jgi:hypothetical protein
MKAKQLQNNRTPLSNVLEIWSEGEIERILRGLPALNEECEAHKFTDDINICEVYSRRLN